MVRFLGIDFAPLNVPFERRLQTFVVFHFAFCNYFSGPLAIVLYIYLFFTEYYYLALLYACWIYYDMDSCEYGGRRWEWLTQLKFWRKGNAYFPLRLIKTAELDAGQNYVLGCHPHGLFAVGHISHFVIPSQDFIKSFPGIHVMAVCLKILFMYPFVRDYLLASGMCAATKRSIHYLLNRNGGSGNAIAIAPGGAAEVYEAHPNTAVIVLKNRRGFIRLAVMNGAHLVPVYAFGETDLYYQVPNPEGSLVRRIQETFKKYTGYPLFYFLVNGRGFFQYTFGILPHRRPIYTVVGKPIAVEKCENPTSELIDKYHELYVKSLQKLFDEHKVKLGGHFTNQKLIIK